MIPKGQKKDKKTVEKLITEADIKADLIAQLTDKGVVGKQYYDLINDYMAMWHIKNELIADIKKNGVNVKWQNGPSQFGYKKNDCLSELNKTNAQMLKILSELRLKAITAIVIKADPDDEL